MGDFFSKLPNAAPSSAAETLYHFQTKPERYLQRILLPAEQNWYVLKATHILEVLTFNFSFRQSLL